MTSIVTLLWYFSLVNLNLSKDNQSKIINIVYRTSNSALLISHLTYCTSNIVLRTSTIVFPTSS
jgi:hypothetical protein